MAGLLEALAGLRNRRAIVALLGCAVVGVVVAALVASTGRAFGIFALLLATLVWFVAIGTGVNAAGVLQMDEARRISPRSTIDALVYGLLCIPKLVLLLLAALAVEIVVFILIAVLLLFCKIPFLGPLLFVAVFPLSVLAAGITVVGVFLFTVLSLPAIWQGAAIARALAQAWAVVRSRLVEAVLMLLALGLLCALAAFVVFGVLGAGLVPTLGLSASILQFGGLPDMGGMGGAPQAGGGRYTDAAVIGGLLLWAVAASLVGQVYLRGLSLTYLRLTDGLDLGAVEATLRATFDDARRRTTELAEKAKSAAQREPAAAAATPSPVLDPPPTYEPAPAHEPAPLYNPPPAYSPPLQAASAAADAPADIDLPFDDAPAAVSAAAPSIAAPPAWAPPPVAAPSTADIATEPVAPTTCPQCLSPVTSDDLFCGVCGYRLK